jgi:hypothetical protein
VAEGDAAPAAAPSAAPDAAPGQEVADAAADLVVAGHNEEVSRRRPKLCLDLHPSTP